MTDRLRYRAWDKNEKCYCYDVQEVYDCAPIGSSKCRGSFASFLDEDYYYLEQCTGLEDKKGTLIYEGDIVTCEIGCQRDLRKQVIFEGGCFGIIFESKFYALRFISKKEWEVKNIEVAGNIHENAELLEGR